MEKLEMLLYKVLAAKEGDKDTSVHQGVCSLKNKDGCPPGDINCDYINLLNGTSNCQMCVQGDWQSEIPCKLQWGSKSITINDMNNNVKISINEDGSVSGTIINESIALKAYGFNCVLSQYTYKNKSSEVDLLEKVTDMQLWYCDNEDKDFHKQFYCVKVKEENDDKIVCYKMMGNCLLDKHDKLSCETKEYKSDKVFQVIKGKPCKSLKENMGSLTCTITIAAVSDNIVTEGDEHHWNKEEVNVTVTCSGVKICSLHVSDLCNENSACKFGGGKSTDNQQTPEDLQEQKSDSNSSTIFLILVIIILVVLLVLYCGYQNQWHHKVSMLCVSYLHVFYIYLLLFGVLYLYRMK